jgi:hypothetical protein
VSGTLDAARADGRLLLRLPLEAVEADYLVRDRLVADEEELGHLMASIAEMANQPCRVAERRRVDTADLGLAQSDGAGAAGPRRAQVSALFWPNCAAPTPPPAPMWRWLREWIRSGLSYYEQAVTTKAVEADAFQTKKRLCNSCFGRQPCAAR